MTENTLRERVAAFASLTDEILQLARSGDWMALVRETDRRDQVLDELIALAGSRLLDQLPDLKPVLVDLLEKNRLIDTLVAERQRELAVELVPARQERRLKNMYRP